MGKLLLALWIFLGSVVGLNPHSTALHTAQAVVSPTATPSPALVYSEMPNKLVVIRLEDKTGCHTDCCVVRPLTNERVV